MKNLNKLFYSSIILATILIPNKTYALTKDETIYTNLNKDGSLFKTTVVNHLYNSNEDNIEDITELKEILNLNGKEKFTISGSNINWNNKGHEIFYQGTTTKELPITTSIEYYLDGQKIESKDLTGKKGSVKIVIKLTNTDQHEVIVNGNKETLYTPFVVTSGTIISNKNNSNISVSNGKVVNNGSKSVLVSLASPGLYENIKNEEFKEMDTITISFDTTKYKDMPIYLVATPKLIDNADLKVFNKLDSLYNNVDKLQTNMNTIEKGANSLEEGANKLASGSKEISDNLLNLVNYMKQLENGSKDLDEGINTLLIKLEYAKNLIETPDTTELDTLSAGNNQAINELTTTNQMIKNMFVQYNIDIDNTLVEYLPENLQTYKKTYDGNNKLIYLLGQNNYAIEQTKAKTLETTLTIQSLLAQLKSGVGELKAGSNTLYTSTSQIRNGIQQLYSGSVTLTEGANTLATGTTTLKSGISTYNREGINTLSNYANKARNYTNKLEALVKLSNDYKGFASTNSNTSTFVTVIK